MTVTILTWALIALFPPAPSAAAQWLGEAALASAFKGATIDGVYTDGTTFRERYDADGRLHYRERDEELTGHWSVVAGSFCTIYDERATGGCYRVQQVSANCFEFYFVTRTEEQAAAPDPKRPSWTARAWRTDAASTCEDKPTV